VSKSSELYQWFQLNEEYFTGGHYEPTQIFVQNSTVKFDSVALQNRMHGLDTSVQECKGCEQGWHLKRSLRSWYADYTNWVSVGFCSYVTPAVIPG